jgi:hypothetical protein
MNNGLYPNFNPVGAILNLKKIGETTLTSGTGTWYPPAGTKFIYVVMCGGGGGGSAGASGNGGGGGAATWEKLLPNIYGSTGVSYTVGSQGTSGGQGGTSIFDMLVAPGGRAGNYYNSASVVGGQGGGTNSDAQLIDTTLYPSITIANGFTPGGAGGSYWTGSSYTATDGRMAGLPYRNFAGSVFTQYGGGSFAGNSGGGGNSLLGKGGNGASTGQAGNGTGYGAGGGGSGTAAQGGTGTPGIIMLWAYI